MEQSNVTSVEKQGAGDYTVNISDLGTASYMVLAALVSVPAGSTPRPLIAEPLNATSFRVYMAPGGPDMDFKFSAWAKKIG